MSLAAYMVDAVFNFPSDRPNIQILFLFSAAAIVSYFINPKKDVEKKVTDFEVKNKGLWIVVLISFATVYLSAQAYRSFVIQFKISEDYPERYSEYKQQSRFKADEVVPFFPAFPNLAFNGMPVAYIKARYLFNDNRYDDAKALLNEGNTANKYMPYDDLYLSKIKAKQNQPDSAYYFARKAFYKAPNFMECYEYLCGLAYSKGDTAEIYKAFRSFTTYHHNPDVWFLFAKNFYSIDTSKSIAILNEGLMLYPGDSSLMYLKSFVKGQNCYIEKKYSEAVNYYKEALKYKPNDDLAQKNMAIAINLTDGSQNSSINLTNKQLTNLPFSNPINANEFNANGQYYFENEKYKQAIDNFIKAAQLDTTDAQILFNIALSYHKLGNDKKGKGYFEKANSLKKNKEN